MTTPQCPHFGTCGGCQLQHLAYEQQLANKRERLAYLLAQQYTGEIAVFPSTPYAYRNRMDFLFTQKGPSLRMVENGTTPITQCAIADQRITQALTELREWFSAHPELEPFERKRNTGTLKYATVRTAQTVAIIFMLNEDSSQTAAHIEAIKAFAQTSTAETVLIAYTPARTDESLSLDYFAVKGDEYLVEEVCGTPLTYHAVAFFQNNPTVAQQMVAYVRDALKARDCAKRAVVDAYGGVGTFAFALAPHCAKVISVESHPLAAQRIERTKQHTNITNVEAVTMDASAMHKLAIPQEALFIVDPPRSGMDQKVLRYLLQRLPPVIAYVSCNPAQLAKELVLLGAKYRVTQAALFDMFPQTNHIEAAVILERR